MLPDLDPTTGGLPPGDHEAALDELLARFGTGRRRREELAHALERTVDFLWAHGVRTIVVDGSFCTSERRPQDVDVWYDPDGADGHDWGIYSRRMRRELKRRDRIDLCRHPMRIDRNPVSAFLPDAWRTDSEDRPRGIVRVIHSEGDNR